MSKGLMLFLLVYPMSLNTVTATEAWQPRIIQTLLDHQLANKEFTLNEKQVIKFILYEKVVESGLTYSDFDKLVKVAQCESGITHFVSDGKPIQGPDGKDFGVFQIRIVHKAKAEELGIDYNQLEGNIDFAIYLYKQSGLKAWSSSSKCWRRL